MSKQKAKEEKAESQTRENPDVAVVKEATAPKLSPKGEGGVTYQVGRAGGDVYVRIERNEGGGSHSREFVGAGAIRAAVTPAMRRGEPFKSDALAAAFVGKSQCNSGFLVAVLRAEQLFSADPERRGMSRLTGDLDAWEAAMREAPPLQGEDGQLRTVKLRPEPKETRFRPAGDATPPDADGEPAPRPHMIKRIKRPPAGPAKAEEGQEHPAEETIPTADAGPGEQQDGSGTAGA